MGFIKTMLSMVIVVLSCCCSVQFSSVLGLQVSQSSTVEHLPIPLKANCSSSQFQCTNGGCIPIGDVCDCFMHCSDGADEKDCPIEGLFTSDHRHVYPIYCPDGKCLFNSNICNGHKDCEDGSDEKNCTGVFLPLGVATCNKHQFECSDGECIQLRYMCNGLENCDDGSDETNCTGKCKEFECDNGKCIFERRVCNCHEECGDGSDENNCNGEIFHCPNGTCLLKSDVCNCEDNCGDSADEENCQGQTFHCPDGTCLLSSKVCNCKDDCGDGADEENCELDCTAKIQEDYLFTCHQINRTLKKKYLNDGFDDCGDGSDENYCSAEPYHCANGECFLKSTVCENIYGCSNRSDGEKCIGSCSEFQCREGGPCIHNNYVCDCTDDCGDLADEKNCTPGVHMKKRKIGISSTYNDLFIYHCGNGQCFTALGHDPWTCKFGPKCNNYYDEMECSGYCDGFQCPSGRCLSFTVMLNEDQCDGVNHCGDWSDEKNCPVSGAVKRFEGPFSNTFSNTQCDVIDYDDGLSLEQCLVWCESDLACTAVNYNEKYKGGGCVRRACAFPIPYPQGTENDRAWKGYSKKSDAVCIDGSAKILEDGCNYCICINGEYKYCTERTCKSSELLSTEDPMSTEEIMDTEASVQSGDLGDDQ